MRDASAANGDGATWADWRGLDDAGQLDALCDATDWLVVLTTHGRGELAATTITALHGAAANAAILERATLLVLHDPCGTDYAAARAAAARWPRHLWLEARAHLGKAGFWRVHDAALRAAARLDPEFVLAVQDDITFAPDMLQRARGLWQATASDPRRRVLNLFASADDEPQGRWLRFRRRPVPGLPLRWTNWFDLPAFVIDRAGLALLDWRVLPVPPRRWRRRPEMSSGVGRQLTLRLRGHGHVYQCWPTLTWHGGAPSRMNPQARLTRPMDNRPPAVAPAAG